MRMLMIPQQPDRPDIDDLIFAGETLNGREMSQPCSDR